MKFLFLCTQPASYLFDSISILANEHEVQVVHYRLSKDAPIDIFKYKNFKLCEYVEHEDLVIKFRLFSPDVVLAAGWTNLTYLKCCYHFKLLGKMTVLTSDNPYIDNLFNRISAKYFGLYIRRYFTHTWVPGRKQYEFMKRLGFQHNQIILDLYTANNYLFDSNLNNLNRYNDNIKKILFIGRIVDYKGVKLIYDSFNEIARRHKDKFNWRLEIIGNGELEGMLTSNEYIKKTNFLQPFDIKVKMLESHGFILASKLEHWGVAVHEAAHCGLPLLLSESVGASERFLINKHNGYYHKPFCKESIIRSMENLFSCSNSELIEMSINSKRLAQRITLNDWVSQIVGASLYFYKK